MRHYLLCVLVSDWKVGKLSFLQGRERAGELRATVELVVHEWLRWRWAKLHARCSTLWEVAGRHLLSVRLEHSVICPGLPLRHRGSTTWPYAALVHTTAREASLATTVRDYYSSWGCLATWTTWRREWLVAPYAVLTRLSAFGGHAVKRIWLVVLGILRESDSF